MGKPFHSVIASLVLTLSVAQAGLFPVLPGEQVFPFSGQNTIIPDYPPCEQAGIIEFEGVSGLGIAAQLVVKGRTVPGFLPDWLSHGHFLSRIQFSLVRSVLYWVTTASLVPRLAPFQIVFPFHAFW